MTISEVYDSLKTYIDTKLNNLSLFYEQLFIDYKTKEVGSNIDIINAVGTNITHVNNIGSYITDVSLVGDDLAKGAGTNSPNDSAILNALNNANNALSYLNDFKGRYFGGLATDPTVDLNGDALSDGDLYFNTTSKAFRAYDLDTDSWVQIAVNVYSGSDAGTSTFVNTIPSNPTTGDIVIDLIGGNTQTWDGTQWVVENYTPTSSGIAKIAFVDALPNTATAQNGDVVYNTSDGQTYILNNGTWTNLGSTVTPVASTTSGINVVTALPTIEVDGEVIYNSTDKKLYQGINGVWTQVVEPTTAAQTVADGSINIAKFASGLTPVEIVDVLPADNNFVGRMAYFTTDGKLYRYTASGWSSAVSAVDLTGQITSTQIGDNSISSSKIQANSITGDKIQAGTITASNLSADALQAGTVQAGSITSTELASGAVTTDKLYAGAVTAGKIATNAIDATKIIAGSISGDKISANAIATGHIKAGAVTADQIASNAISANKIQANSISGSKIQAGAIGASQISANAVTTDKLATGSITADKLTTGAVTADKIAVSTKYLPYGSFSFGAGTKIGNYYSAGAFATNINTYAGLNVASTADIWAIGAGSCTAGGQAGIFVNSTSSSFTTHYTQCTLGTRNNAIETGGNIQVSGNITATGTIGNFTGAHYAIVDKNEVVELGDCVSVVDVAKINISETYSRVTRTANINDKAIFGIVSYISENTAEEADVLLKRRDEHLNYSVDSAYQEIYNLLKSGNYVLIKCNALGEGQMKVNSSNGMIKRGDYITSSNTVGEGCRQDDGVLYNYTIAKALEDQTQTSQLLAVTYHCS